MACCTTWADAGSVRDRTHARAVLNLQHFHAVPLQPDTRCKVAELPIQAPHNRSNTRLSLAEPHGVCHIRAYTHIRQTFSIHTML